MSYADEGRAFGSRADAELGAARAEVGRLQAALDLADKGLNIRDSQLAEMYKELDAYQAAYPVPPPPRLPAA